MTTQEFSSEFDILYNNIMSNSAPGLDEYEKSVLLTQAQEQLILDIYSGTSMDSFESTEEMKEYLDVLVQQDNLTVSTEDIKGLSPSSKFYNKPEDLWFITYETAILKDASNSCLKNGKTSLVIPVTQDEYYHLMENPFRRPNMDRVFRLLKDNKIELISSYPIDSYTIRYIRKPNPIILTDLTEYNTKIDGESDVKNCELSPAIHRVILVKAVQLAKSLWSTGNN